MATRDNPFAYSDQFVIADAAPVAARGDFIAKTYIHLTGAVLAFAAICAAILNTPAVLQPILELMLGNQWGPLIFVGGFMVVSWVANSWARSGQSVGLQYAGLALYVVAEAIIITPLLWIADRMGGNVIATAGVVTFLLFLGMSAIVYITRFNFSFLGPFLMVAGLGAIGLILCSILFGFTLGLAFTVAMIVLACGYILYDTSNVLHQYAIGQHVAASLALFASVALLFWYVLRLVMSLQSRD